MHMYVRATIRHNLCIEYVYYGMLIISYLCCGAVLAVGTSIPEVTGAHTTQTTSNTRAELQTRESENDNVQCSTSKE